MGQYLFYFCIEYGEIFMVFLYRIWGNSNCIFFMFYPSKGREMLVRPFTKSVLQNVCSIQRA